MTFEVFDFLKFNGEIFLYLEWGKKQRFSSAGGGQWQLQNTVDCLRMRGYGTSLEDLQDTWFLKGQQVLMAYKTLRSIKPTMLHIFIILDHMFTHLFIIYCISDNNGLGTWNRQGPHSDRAYIPVGSGTEEREHWNSK